MPITMVIIKLLEMAIGKEIFFKMMIVGILLMILSICFIVCLGFCQNSNISTTLYDKQLNDEIQMAYLSKL